MSRERFPHLFEPLPVGQKTMRNRVVHAPMSVAYADEEGRVTQKEIEHYGRRAQGGVGMVITENFAISESGRQLPKQTYISDEEQLPGLDALAAEVRKHGALAVTQVVHAGRYAGPWDQYEKRRRLAPSSVSFPLVAEVVATPQEITPEEIRGTVQDFGRAAEIAEKAGFDGVEIHGAQGFLIAGFTSPHTNRRTDEYGGGFENRIRFALEVVREIKGRVGEDFVVGYQLMSDELMPGGWGIGDSVELAKRLEREGVHFILPAPSTFEALRRPENLGLLGRTMYALDDVIAIGGAVDIPVIANGKLEDPYVAEHVLKHGEADAVALARPLFADPDWVRKVEAGMMQEIRTCSCDPPTCLQTQLTGAICGRWPEEIREQGYLGYNSPAHSLKGVG